MRLDLKRRFFEKNGWGPALKPGITLPTGDAGKGPGGAEAHPLPLTAPCL
jgi:hypothetical protein